MILRQRPCRFAAAGLSAGRDPRLLSGERAACRHLCVLRGRAHLRPLRHGGFAPARWWLFRRGVKRSSKPAGAGNSCCFWPAGPAAGLYLWDFLKSYLWGRNTRAECKATEQPAAWNSRLLKQGYGDGCSRGHFVSFLLMTLVLLSPVLGRVRNDVGGGWGFFTRLLRVQPGRWVQKRAGCRWLLRDLKGEEGCTGPVREQVKINPRETDCWARMD